MTFPTILMSQTATGANQEPSESNQGSNPLAWIGNYISRLFQTAPTSDSTKKPTYTRTLISPIDSSTDSIEVSLADSVASEETYPQPTTYYLETSTDHTFPSSEEIIEHLFSQNFVTTDQIKILTPVAEEFANKKIEDSPLGILINLCFIFSKMGLRNQPALRETVIGLCDALKMLVVPRETESSPSQEKANQMQDYLEKDCVLNFPSKDQILAHLHRFENSPKLCQITRSLQQGNALEMIADQFANTEKKGLMDIIINLSFMFSDTGWKNDPALVEIIDSLGSRLLEMALEDSIN